VSLSSPSSGRSGRRPGPTQSRDAIAAAAREQFAEVGYDRATFRAIASAAGVDPALVVHFFGSKESLFREVMALPPAVGEAIAALATGPPETVGRRVAEILVGLIDNPSSRALVVGRIRSAASQPHAAELVRETVTRDLQRLAAAITDDRPATRAVLVGSHLVGIAFARHVVLVEPLAAMSTAEVVDLVAPTFQRFLAGPLD
jgi:AcrR family transcriptional regulator